MVLFRAIALRMVIFYGQQESSCASFVVFMYFRKVFSALQKTHKFSPGCIGVRLCRQSSINIYFSHIFSTHKFIGGCILRYSLALKSNEKIKSFTEICKHNEQTSNKKHTYVKFLMKDWSTLNRFHYFSHFKKITFICIPDFFFVFFILVSLKKCANYLSFNIHASSQLLFSYEYTLPV